MSSSLDVSLSCLLHCSITMKVKVSIAQLYLTLWPHGCSPPGSSVHGILQARVLEWIAMPSSRGSSRPRDRTQVSRIAGRFFTSWATREVLQYLKIINCFIFKSYYQFFKSIIMTSLFEKKKTHYNQSIFLRKKVCLRHLKSVFKSLVTLLLLLHHYFYILYIKACILYSWEWLYIEKVLFVELSQ